MRQKLMEYFEKAALEKWSWGTNDCVMFAADWVICSSGIDIAKSIRGKYSSELGAARIASKRGGFVAGVSGEIDRFMGRTNDPYDGDIGIVRTQIYGGSVGELMAIRSSGMWICRHVFGLTSVGADHLIAWRVKCRQF